MRLIDPPRHGGSNPPGSISLQDRHLRRLAASSRNGRTWAHSPDPRRCSASAHFEAVPTPSAAPGAARWSGLTRRRSRPGRTVRRGRRANIAHLAYAPCPLRLLGPVFSERIGQPYGQRLWLWRAASVERRLDGGAERCHLERCRLPERPEIEVVLHAAVRHAQHDDRVKLLRDKRAGIVVKRCGGAMARM